MIKIYAGVSNTSMMIMIGYVLDISIVVVGV
jgi:hypothetical protein